MSELADRARRILTERHLLQKDLAHEAGVMESVVSTLMQGRDVRMSTYLKITKALDRLESRSDTAAR